MSGNPATSVPQPVFGPNGFIVPAEEDVLAGVQADINGAFGGKLNFTTQSASPTNSTAQGQLAASESAIIADSYAMFLWFTNQVDPAYSSGRMQDAIARIYFLERIPGAPTIVQAACSGLTDVIIPIGALAKAADGNLYVCTQAGTIPASGSVVLPFACTIDGPIECPATALNTIYQAIFGWDTINNVADGALGQNVESRSQFEIRRGLSTGWNAMGPLGAIQGAVLQVAGVLDAYVTENDNSIPQTIGGVSLAPNSLYVCALGGSAQTIAEAIWSRKMPGCVYNGNVTQIVFDPSPEYSPPIPQYAVTYQTPAIVSFAVLVVIKNNINVPANALTLVQNAIMSAFVGTDGGPRATIGSTVYASRYYAGVVMLGAWATQIIDIQLGISGANAAFTASIAGTAMTVSGVASGTLAVGQFLQDITSNLASGTTITGFVSGTLGGIGIYDIYPSQTVVSEAMTGTNMANDITMNINQAPSVAAVNIGMQLV